MQYGQQPQCLQNTKRTKKIDNTTICPRTQSMSAWSLQSKMSINSINDLGFLGSCLDLQHLDTLTQHWQCQLAKLHNQTIKQLALAVQHMQIQHKYTLLVITGSFTNILQQCFGECCWKKSSQSPTSQPQRWNQIHAQTFPLHTLLLTLNLSYSSPIYSKKLQ